ncbi:MAG: DUF3486 family protein [Nitrospirae bacterium]|nr:DUF3486 family protein [Nitrospirota bacterium]
MAQHQRKHSSLDDLPGEVKKEVHALLIEPNITYEDVGAFLKTKGHDISKSAIGRYGKSFFNEVRETEMLRDQAALITSEPDKAMLLEKLTATMITKRLALALQNEEFDVMKNAKLIQAFAALQKSSMHREQWHTEVKDKIVKTADDVSKIAKKGGLTDDAAAQIRAKILGIAK